MKQDRNLAEELRRRQEEEHISRIDADEATAREKRHKASVTAFIGIAVIALALLICLPLVMWARAGEEGLKFDDSPVATVIGDEDTEQVTTTETLSPEQVVPADATGNEADSLVKGYTTGDTFEWDSNADGTPERYSIVPVYAETPVPTEPNQTDQTTQTDTLLSTEAIQTEPMPQSDAVQTEPMLQAEEVHAEPTPQTEAIQAEPTVQAEAVQTEVGTQQEAQSMTGANDTLTGFRLNEIGVSPESGETIVSSLLFDGTDPRITIGEIATEPSASESASPFLMVEYKTIGEEPMTSSAKVFRQDGQLVIQNVTDAIQNETEGQSIENSPIPDDITEEPSNNLIPDQEDSASATNNDAGEQENANDIEMAEIVADNPTEQTGDPYASSKPLDRSKNDQYVLYFETTQSSYKNVLQALNNIAKTAKSISLSNPQYLGKATIEGNDKYYSYIYTVDISPSTQKYSNYPNFYFDWYDENGYCQKILEKYGFDYDNSSWIIAKKNRVHVLISALSKEKMLDTINSYKEFLSASPLFTGYEIGCQLNYNYNPTSPHSEDNQPYSMISGNVIYDIELDENNWIEAYKKLLSFSESLIPDADENTGEYDIITSVEYDSPTNIWSSGAWGSDQEEMGLNYSSISNTSPIAYDFYPNGVAEIDKYSDFSSDQLINGEYWSNHFVGFRDLALIRTDSGRIQIDTVDLPYYIDISLKKVGDFYRLSVDYDEEEAGTTNTSDPFDVILKVIDSTGNITEARKWKVTFVDGRYTLENLPSTSLDLGIDKYKEISCVIVGSNGVKYSMGDELSNRKATLIKNIGGYAQFDPAIRRDGVPLGLMEVTFKSSNSRIVAVENYSGFYGACDLYGNSAGTAKVTATITVDDCRLLKPRIIGRKTFTVNVKNTPRLSAKDNQFDVGSSAIVATCQKDAGAVTVTATNNNLVRFEQKKDSSGISIVARSRGAVGTTTATIKVAGNSKYLSRTKKITIKVTKKPTRIEATASYTKKVRQSFKLNAKMMYVNSVTKKKTQITSKTQANGLRPKLIYVSSNPAVATVSADGTVRTKKVGKATITIKLEGNGLYKASSKKVTVTVTK